MYFLWRSSVQSLSRVWLFATPWTAARQARLSITDPKFAQNSCLSNWWCHPTISSSVIPLSSCPQSFPTSGPFLMSQFFTSGGQNIGVSASASVLPMNIQDWFPLIASYHLKLRAFASLILILQLTFNLKVTLRNFSFDPVAKNPPANARDTGFIPGPGAKIPHAAKQLNPCASLLSPYSGALVPQLLSPHYSRWSLCA